MDDDFEEWRPMAGFPAYQVSDHGRVRRSVDAPRGSARARKSRAGHVLSTHWHKTQRYMHVVLSLSSGRRVSVSLARSVLTAFRPTTQERHRHPVYLDGDRRNCRIKNLQWSTPGSWTEVDLLAGVGMPERRSLDVSARRCANCEREFRHYGTSFTLCPQCRSASDLAEARRLAATPDRSTYQNCRMVVFR